MPINFSKEDIELLHQKVIANLDEDIISAQIYYKVKKDIEQLIRECFFYEETVKSHVFAIYCFKVQKQQDINEIIETISSFKNSVSYGDFVSEAYLSFRKAIISHINAFRKQSPSLNKFTLGDYVERYVMYGLKNYMFRQLRYLSRVELRSSMDLFVDGSNEYDGYEPIDYIAVWDEWSLAEYSTVPIPADISVKFITPIIKQLLFEQARGYTLKEIMSLMGLPLGLDSNVFRNIRERMSLLRKLIAGKKREKHETTCTTTE